VKLRILPEASEDLIDGQRFYEKRTAGVGNYFVDSLLSDIDSLVLYAGVHPKHDGKYHRALSRRFPFAIYYRIQGESVVVYAVLDCRRDPAWIRDRLG